MVEPAVAYWEAAICPEPMTYGVPAAMAEANAVLKVKALDVFEAIGACWPAYAPPRNVTMYPAHWFVVHDLDESTSVEGAVPPTEVA